MRSIRLSLTVYFLALFGVALGAGAAIVYETTRSSLETRQRATEEVLRANQKSGAKAVHDRYKSALRRRCEKNREAVQAESEALDNALLRQAELLLGLAQGYIDTRKIDYALDLGGITGSLSAPAAPQGHLLMHLWLGQHGVKVRRDHWVFHASPVSREIFGRMLRDLKAEIKIDAKLLKHLDMQVAEYYQINGDWGGELLSPSLQMLGRFEFSPDIFQSAEALSRRFDTVDLGPNLKVRLVKLKAPAAQPIPRPWREPRRGGPGPDRDRDRDRDRPPRPEVQLRPSILVQCACSTQRHEALLADLERTFNQEKTDLLNEREAELGLLNDRLNEDLAGEQAATVATLRSVRGNLLLVCLATFAAVLVGTFALVRLGLSPLRRLSDAVSRVSERDFRLHLDRSPLPGELTPIAERLKQTLAQLERAFSREKQATADISHELRTPLAALLTTIDVALRKQRSAQEYRDALEDCRASGQQINQAVERLLALARLDAGVDLPRPKTVDAAGLARQCVAVVRPLAEAHGLRVHVNGDPTVPVQADPDKLREILNNLLHNAIQYNRPNGSIDVSVERQNGHLTLEVRDTGIGIAPAARPHIFERFYRADPARQSDGLHTGLGLAIVKGYVDLMGGSIAVDSTEGEGSTFRVELPA